MIHEATYALAGLIFALYAVDFALSCLDDSREPPRLRPKIPLIGHLLGLITNGTTYYSVTSKSTDAELYTLGIFNYKIYVSNSNRLMPLIQKASKSLSFKPFMQTATKTHSGASDETYHIFGNSDMLDSYSHAMKTSLAPGPHLDEQNLRMGKRVMADIDALLNHSQSETQRVKLLEWARHAIVQASSCGVYGEHHPFVRSEVERAYWTWQDYIGLHLVGLDVTGTGYAAREKVVDAYRQYMKRLPGDAALLVKERVRVLREAGVPEQDIAPMESSFGVAVFSNTSPTLFWAIWELFSRPDVLHEVREEVRLQAVTGSAKEGFELDVAALKLRCPLLLSVFQETQRMRHVHANIRKVLYDTVIDGKFLLKAGNFLHLPAAPIHSSENIWGASASVFDPYRFADTKNTASVTGSAFLPWGAPPHLCPARQFASTEILIIIALLAMRADLQPIGGIWKSPPLKTADMVTVLNPTRDVEMDVNVRKQWEGEWRLRMSESTSRISLASG
ncbi:uncharacterized protein JN550_007577 [Neoarthrinium moseri]|uniref:uncharacterized protein n=1 Tax=Neoarthrinium moseri TaxID=1658444 RepID=UPI001FDB6DBD|nr:uncharacterized protein JN550_007577 [Neoarthrinium moseri]KAI1866724.1 hypothetical protein JN550_007577 [Neoarthrinium moseri]